MFDRFVKRCDVKDPAWQQLWLKESVKLTYRQHSISRVFSADADDGSVVRVFFDDFLAPDDESGLAELWYSRPQDLREAKAANGSVTYSDRTLKLSGSQRGKATITLVRLVYEDRATGKMIEAGNRSNYSEAPASARWFIECTMTQ